MFEIPSLVQNSTIRKCIPLTKTKTQLNRKWYMIFLHWLLLLDDFWLLCNSAFLGFLILNATKREKNIVNQNNQLNWILNNCPVSYCYGSKTASDVIFERQDTRCCSSAICKWHCRRWESILALSRLEKFLDVGARRLYSRRSRVWLLALFWFGEMKSKNWMKVQSPGCCVAGWPSICCFVGARIYAPTRDSLLARAAF